jgi:hypothetical protein
MPEGRSSISAGIGKKQTQRSNLPAGRQVQKQKQKQNGLGSFPLLGSKFKVQGSRFFDCAGE